MLDSTRRHGLTAIFADPGSTEAEREERERQKAARARAEAKQELVDRLPSLRPEERTALVEAWRDEYGWADYWDLHGLVGKLNAAEK